MTTVALPPQDLQAEQAVLGAVLLADHILEPLLAEKALRPEHFYRPDHQAIYRAMVALHDRGAPVDTLTVTAELKATGKLDDAGGPHRVDALAAAPPVPGNVREYANVVLREALWRARKRATDLQAAAIADRNEDAYNAAEAARTEIGRADTTTASPEQLASEWLDWYQADASSAIPLPFPRLNHALNGGLRPGDTTIVAGWTSMGKSSLADQVLAHAAGEGFRGWAYINEMGRTERTTRMVAAESGVSASRMFSRQLTPDDWQRINPHLDRLPFGITVCAGWPAEDIARHIRRHKWDLAVIDLVTRIPAERTSDWDRVSGVLTDAARQSGTHLLLVCQLNQERVKTVQLPPPVRRDLRNTGSWANDAANVLFVHRDQDEDLDTGIATVGAGGHIRLDKARNGQPASVPVQLNTRTLRFMEAHHE
jgi:replicative DNA helicase